MTFVEHREQSALDCEQVAKSLTQLAGDVRAGNMRAFEEFWIEGGTEEGDSQIRAIIEMIILRYAYREEKAREKAK